MANHVDTWASRRALLTFSLGALTALLLYSCYLLASPFLSGLIWAFALAIVTAPLYDRVAVDRYPNASAALGTLVVAVFVIGPLLWLGIYLSNQMRHGIQALQEESVSDRWQTLIGHYPAMGQFVDWLKEQVDGQSQGQATMDAIKKVVPAVLGGSVWAGAELLVTLFLLFYFLRDRVQIIAWLRQVVPLSDRETTLLFRRVRESIEATVVGTLLIAALKGVQWGVMVWLLGLPVPGIWAAVMAGSSLIPALGAPVVWLSGGLFLLAQGSWGKALIAMGWGAGVIGLIDGMLYPILVGRTVTLHPVPVFFAFLGGVLLFGPSGLVLGPLLLMLTWTLLEIWRARTRYGRAATEALHRDAANT